MTKHPDPSPLVFTAKARINEWSHNPIGGWAQPTLEVGLQSAYGDGGFTFHGKLGFMQVPAVLLPEAAHSWQDAVVEVTFRVLTPQSRLVEWRQDEVPLGCWVRFICDREHGDATRYVVAAVLRDEVRLGNGKGYTFAELNRCCEHSVDGGKTWHPAGRVEVVHV